MLFVSSQGQVFIIKLLCFICRTLNLIFFFIIITELPLNYNTYSFKVNPSPNILMPLKSDKKSTRKISLFYFVDYFGFNSNPTKEGKRWF